MQKLPVSLLISIVRLVAGPLFRSIGFYILCPVFLFLYSCSGNGTKEKQLPAAPASVQAVSEQVKGKKFKAEKAGTHFLSTDKEIIWLDPKETEKFEKEIADESKTLEMEFVNDTSVTVRYKGKTYNGVYSVDDKTGEDEKKGIKLRTSYIDEELKFGDGPASEVTYTYVVEGINDESLLLLTPRSMNNKNIIVLLTKK